MVPLDLEHLARPNRMKNGATTYVVWFQKERQTPSRVEQLAYETGKRMGTMLTTTTNRQFDVLVTADGSSAVPAPSTAVIFEKQVETP